MVNPLSSSRKLYALVIGINGYQYVRPLKGCVHDAENFEAFLKEPFVQSRFDVQLERLTDGAATKDAIVNGIREHLGQAREGDTALMFFAGHGHREQTLVPAFRNAQVDRKMGNLVCVDSNGGGGSAENTCLADKELRYLIYELSKQGPEIITVFDCCHSGDNTREIEIPHNARKISTGAALARPWEGFIFHEEINPKDLEEGYLGDVIPEGRHFQLAACRDVELAWEFNGAGAFTRALLETLRSHQGRIRYHDLYGRVANRMRARGSQQQTPQLYVQTNDPADRYRLFLTHDTDDQPVSTSVTYNEHEDEWRINLGALHGVPIEPSNSNVRARIVSPTDTEFRNQVHFRAVYPGYTVIQPSSELPLDTEGVYRAQVSGLGITPLDIFLKGSTEGVAMMEKFLASKLEQADAPFARLGDTEQDADYVLEAREDLFVMTRPGISDSILMPIQYFAQGKPLAEKLELAHTDLVQMAKWTFLRDLEHQPVFPGELSQRCPSTRPIEIKILQLLWRDGEEIEVSHDVSNGTVNLELTHDHDSNAEVSSLTKNAYSMVRLELTNHSDQELYCTLLYMSQEFGVSFPFFQQAGFWLPSKHSVDSKQFGNQPYIQGTLPKHVIEDRWAGVRDFMKLIVSETQFEVQTLAMENLPSPGAGAERGAFDDKKHPELPRTYWSTQTVELFTVNPYA